MKRVLIVEYYIHQDKIVKRVAFIISEKADLLELRKRMLQEPYVVNIDFCDLVENVEAMLDKMLKQM